MWLVNGMEVAAFEKEMHFAGLPNFRYWITIDVSMPTAVTRYDPYIQTLFWAMWRQRCLIAYPSFFDGYGRDHKHGNVMSMFSEPTPTRTKLRRR